MAEHTSQHLPAPGTVLSAGASFRPRLGDLALDLAKGGRIGVVVALPSGITASYHLRPPGGGSEWTAPRDGATLRPVAVPATHVTPMERDLLYDERAAQIGLPITVHHEDGGTSESLLLLTIGQAELYHSQLSRLLAHLGEER